MDLGRLLHPADREWLVYGIVLFGLWLWAVRRSTRNANAEAELVAKWPTQAARLRELFQFVSKRRLSTLGKTASLLVLLTAVSMVAMAYTTGTSLDGPTFQTLFGLVLAAGFVGGAHLAVNARLINAAKLLDVARQSRENDPPDFAGLNDKGTILVGVVLAALSLFLASCWLFGMPMSLRDLFLMIDK